MRTYDPSEGKLILGISAINNWDSVRASYEEDQIFHSSGTQGEVTRTKNANKLGTFVVTLPQSSIDNETFSNYKLTVNNLGVIRIKIIYSVIEIN